MRHSTLKIALLAASLGFALTGAARADCEADLIDLEKAYKTPALTAAAKAALDEAKPVAVAALKKDDDAACNKAIVAGLAKAGLSGTAAAAPPKAESAPAAVPATAHKLGDLAPFRALAADTLKIVDTGDLAAAKIRIKDLEKAWDDAEPQMKPRDAAAWTVFDKSIDGALKNLRAATPDKAACAQALQSLIAMLDSAAKKT